MSRTIRYTPDTDTRRARRLAAMARRNRKEAAR
jgi:hypothetical protein